MPTIDRALADKRLLGAALGSPATWAVWIAVLRATFGLSLTAKQRAMFAAVAGGRVAPTSRVRELWAIVGRRAGKSRIAAAIAVYLACFVKHALAPGERGTVLVIAGSMDQAATVFSYVRGFFESSPILRSEVATCSRNEMTLRNGIVIAVHTNSFRTVRGRTVVACVFDEVAFWRDEHSATPDVEVYRAILPALATTEGMLVAISTPYRKLGLLYQKHRDHFGVEGNDVLVVQGSTLQFNATIDEKTIAAQLSADPASAKSEWNAQFRADLLQLFDDDAIDAATDHDRPLELPPRADVQYLAHVDAAGGAGGDAYTIAIGHKDGQKLVIDLVRGTIGKFDPAKVTAGYAALLREYKITTVKGDHFAAGWVDAEFCNNGITYERCELKCSQIYLENAPLFARGVAHLPDHPRLVREMRLLERHVHRSGREAANHPKGGTDDFANVVCGVLRSLSVAGPALWRRDDLLANNAAIAVPTRADCLFAVLVGDDRGRAGVVHFALRRVINPPLILIDFDLVSLAPQSFHAIMARLAELASEMKTPWASLFTQSPFVDELARLGYRSGIEAIDHVAKDELLATGAARHIGAARVKISVIAHARTETLPLNIFDGTSSDDADPLRLAALIGIAVGLDEGRTLKPARAA